MAGKVGLLVSVVDTDGTFTVTATSTSGLGVCVASNLSSVCSVAGLSVSIIGVGQCTLTATQAGTVQFAPAQAVSHSVTVIAVSPPTTTTVALITTTIATTITIG